MAGLREFVEEYRDRFDLDLKTADRELLVNSIRETLRAGDLPAQSQQLFTALNAIRILSRAKHDIKEWMDEEMFSLLMIHSLLDHYKHAGDAVLLPDNIDTDVVTEAIKCLCNLTMNSERVQAMCEKSQCVLGLLQRAKTYFDKSIQHTLKFFDMRLLFLVTALAAKTRSTAALEWDGISTLTQVLRDILSSTIQPSLTNESCDLILELLKILYNFTSVLMPWKEKYDSLKGDLTQLVSTIRLVLTRSCDTKEKHLDIIKNCTNLFTVLPSELGDILVPPVDTSEDTSCVQRLFEGHDVSAISEMLDLLQVLLEDSTLQSQKERLFPFVLTLTSISRSNRIIRRYCRHRVLPPLRSEVKRLPEEGDSLRNRLCKLLTTPHTNVKHVVADFLYVLCKENVSRLIKYSGFGNAAGLLAQYGLMAGQSSTSTSYSDDSDSDTEEYRDLQADVNPVTGRYETERPSPMQGMTEEQKEYEAIQLINAVDKLQRLGVVQPSTIGPDGKPKPVEHVLELAQEHTRSDDESEVE